ncbi:MAG: long-chain fatty acid transporter, partial [Gemmatimonadetes bacterium]|nr:long-chain fatty acid transporter [Gemmatimonadota bacterium]
MRIRPGLLSVLLVAAALPAAAIVNIQSLGASARSTALGNAYVAVADNGDAVFANPAGLASVDGRQLA